MNNYADTFYRDFGLTPLPKAYLKNQEVYNLFTKPLKETKLDMPRFYNFKENDTHQADVLFLPHDEGYAYALVVTDVATGKTDAEPLKYQKGWDGPTVDDTMHAIAKIYSRGILKYPTHLITDFGPEFRDKFQRFLGAKHISYKKALAGRHRQMSPVERKNQILGRIIFMRMFSQELLTGQPSTEWINDLPFFIEKMNIKYSHNPETDESLYKKFDPVKNLKQKIIPIGTNVRIILDEPRNYKETKLSGTFRSTDQRWYQDIYKITGYIFDPHEPVMYKTNKPLKEHEKVAYTAKQLQIVPDNEEDPNPISIRTPNSKQEFAIKKLIDKRVQGSKSEYLVLWKGYTQADATWLYKSSIPKSFVAKYEAEH